MPQFRDDELDGLGLFGSESVSSDPQFAPAESAVEAFAPEPGPPELAAPEPAAPKPDARSGERCAIVALDAGDALAAFASETPVPEATPARRRTAPVLPREADAGRAPKKETILARPIPPALPRAPQARLVRWVLPIAATLFLVGPSALVGWHVTRSRAMPGGAAVVPHRPALFASAQAAIPAPPGPADLAVLPAAVSAAPSSSIATPRETRDESSVRRDAETATAVSGDTTSPPGDVEAPRATEDSPRLAALAPPADAGAARALDLIPGARVAAEPLSFATATAGDEAGVREALRSFRSAYERLDVDGAAEVWPSVDRRALARAFDGLQSQTVDFQRCDISVAGEEATADCRGRIAVIRKVGNPVPLAADQQWIFAMRRHGPVWRIEGVVSSQSAAQAAEGTDEPR